MESIQVNGSVYKVDKKPNVCPICNVHIMALQTQCGNVVNNNFLEVIFRCPRQECSKLFISYFNAIRFTGGFASEFEYSYSAPKVFRSRLFSEQINMISPQFTVIYNQASQAESFGLDQVCGPGYRKALEFLLKDYLINLYPKRREEIINKFIGNCIKELITNENIRICAERATWIGNDETHYTRTLEDKDITNLKELIDLTIHWISSELITAKYKVEMPNKK